MQLINNMVNMKNEFIGNTFAKVFLTKWESSVLLFPVSARAYLIFFERRLKCIEGTSGNLQSRLRTRHKTLTSSILWQPLNLWAVSNFLNTAIQYSLCQLLLVSTICWKTFVRETSGGILSLPHTRQHTNACSWIFCEKCEDERNWISEICLYLKL